MSFNVLVCDDDQFTLVMYKNIFSKSNSIKLDPYLQGKEAVAGVKSKYETAQQHDVALIDMRMPPGIDGLETAIELRKINPTLPIAFISGYSDNIADKITTAIKGPTLWFSKPFKSAEIYQAVYECCLSKQWGDTPIRLYGVL
ncbi:MAG: response regulator [Gammaproteobacteria bacterium]|jgi:CheY-like chemotaxis protein|nr:response regulator [Gammaproteobacteria bacterium]MBT4606908.1 response regulator [Thiotrichales bacterium]MBT3472836.1 response regulator [Gammaproteobacteria bacterium]MBT3966348.1 response regulator [Gammaproteobacteria bacterium]MBT4079398.1 response regulator [Gammaproteobacteria bacterium]